MKKIIKAIMIALCGLFLAAGVYFGIARPTYVQEALGILFSNELTTENIIEQNGIAVEDTDLK